MEGMVGALDSPALGLLQWVEAFSVVATRLPAPLVARLQSLTEVYEGELAAHEEAALKLIQRMRRTLVFGNTHRYSDPVSPAPLFSSQSLTMAHIMRGFKGRMRLCCILLTSSYLPASVPHAHMLHDDYDAARSNDCVESAASNSYLGATARHKSIK